jgi:hypothetical protein
MKKLNKTQKIFLAFALATLLAFCIWGCGTKPSTEVKTDSTTTTVDTASLDTLK